MVQTLEGVRLPDLAQHLLRFFDNLDVVHWRFQEKALKGLRAAPRGEEMHLFPAA